jgi:hypothetical protein
MRMSKLWWGDSAQNGKNVIGNLKMKAPHDSTLKYTYSDFIYSLEMTVSALDSWEPVSELCHRWPGRSYRDLARNVVVARVRNSSVLLDDDGPSGVALGREHPRMVLRELGLGVAQEQL